MNFKLPSVDDRLIWDLWLSIYHMPAVTAADELGIFAALSANPDSPERLAQQLDLNERGMKILLPMLAALDLLELSDGNYRLCEISSAYLLHESPFYWGGVLEVVRNSSAYHQSLCEILKQQRDSTESGSQNSALATTSAWESGAIDSERAQRMARFMQSQSQAAAIGLAGMADFNCVSRLLDAGGGSGCYSIALAQHLPDLHCTVMDLEAMCRLVLDYIDKGAVADRVDTLSLDMFRDPWPDGYDAVLFSNIFHDWDQVTCTQLANSAYRSLPAGGMIYLHEMLLNENGIGPLTVNAFAMVMLLGNRGHQFTFGELQGLLEQAGFTDVKITPAYGYYSLISGVKPN